MAVHAPDHEFVALLPAYRPSGGLATSGEIGARMERAQAGGLPMLAQRIAAHELIHFEWNHSLWLPWFQFNPKDVSVQEGPRRVIQELGETFDGWELAKWFAQPHRYLDGQAPVDLVAGNPTAVIEAARLDHFIACG